MDMTSSSTKLLSLIVFSLINVSAGSFSHHLSSCRRRYLLCELLHDVAVPFVCNRKSKEPLLIFSPLPIFLPCIRILPPLIFEYWRTVNGGGSGSGGIGGGSGGGSAMATVSSASLSTATMGARRRGWSIQLSSPSISGGFVGIPPLVAFTG